VSPGPGRPGTVACSPGPSLSAVAKPRRIALNALFLAPGQSGGTETYLRALVPELARLRPHWQFAIVTTGRGATALSADGFDAFAEIVRLPAEEFRRLRRQLAEQLLLPALVRQRRFDLLHDLAGTGPIIDPGLATVATVHDLIFKRIRTMGALSTWGMGFVIERVAKRADAVIAPSQAAAQEIATALQLTPERITVVPHGCGRPPVTCPDAPDALRDRYGLTGKRVVLCVAALRPHKNQAVLVRALRYLPSDVQLVLVGRTEPYAHELRELAAQLAVASRVVITGSVSNETLEGLWSLASCAAFPTLAEGFGLPVLEAMARGVPVACSDIAVLREVGGDVPTYFDPHDPQAVAEAIELAMQRRDSGAAQARAACFSWRRAAELTLAVYDRVLADS